MANLLQYLKKKKVPCEILDHKIVYTAMDLANTMRVRAQEVAKSLLVKVDKQFVMVILPANHRLSLEKLKQFLKKHGYLATILEIPGEKIMKKFVSLKKETLSAFGSLYQLPVVLEKTFLKNKKLISNAGNFMKAVRISLKEYIKMEEPLVGSFRVARKVAVLRPKKPLARRQSMKKK